MIFHKLLVLLASDASSMWLCHFARLRLPTSFEISEFSWVILWAVSGLCCRWREFRRVLLRVVHLKPKIRNDLGDATGGDMSCEGFQY